MAVKLPPPTKSKQIQMVMSISRLLFRAWRILLCLLSSLLLGALLVGSPPVVEAQETCAETDTAVSGISGTKVVSGSHKRHRR